MSKEIIFKKRDCGAVFILDNSPDCDICQLYIKNKKHSKVNILSTWVTTNFLSAVMNERDRQIAKLKADLDEKDKVIYQNALTIADVQKALNEHKSVVRELEEELNNSEQQCLICQKDQENEQFKKEVENLSMALRRMTRNCNTADCELRTKLAVKELEKVKNNILKYMDEKYPDFTILDRKDVNAIINPQIKALKGNK